MYALIVEIQHCWNPEDRRITFFWSHEAALAFVRGFEPYPDHQYWFYIVFVDPGRVISLDYGATVGFERYSLGVESDTLVREI